MSKTALKVSALFLAVISLVLLGCTKEAAFLLFEDPPSDALSFLGYSDIAGDDKLTVCGNCHVGIQAQWQETPHADAWETLQASGQAQAFCEGCHTVSELGNTVTEAAGYNGAPEARYEDVQCESCHGPGLTHVQNPDASQAALIC